MKTFIICLGINLVATFCFAQQHHVVLIYYPPTQLGTSCYDAVMTKESFNSLTDAIEHERKLFKENKSSSISVYRIRQNEIGIIYEWKIQSGNKLCTKIAVVIGTDESQAMKVLEKQRASKTNVNIIGYLNTAGTQK
jgi:hypothetical protein